MTETVLEIVDLTEIVGDIQLPCDYSDQGWCHDQPAKWVLHLAVCECGTAGQRLACEGCKDMLLTTDMGSLACRVCEFVWHPPRKAYARVEPLDRKGSRR